MKFTILNQVNVDAFDLLKPTVVNCGSALSFAICVQRPTDGFTITGCKVRVTNADGADMTLDATLSGSNYVVTFPASHFEHYGRVENGVAVSVLGADESGVERVWIERLGSLYVRPTDAQSEAGSGVCPTRAEVEAGWWTEWTVLRNGVDVTSQTPQPQYDTGEWDVSRSCIDLDTIMEPTVPGGEDDESISWNARDSEDNDVLYTATRHRVAAPVPMKPSDIGAQAVLTFDTTPTADSANPVTSAGVKTALDLKSAPYPFVDATFGSHGDDVVFSLVPFANNRADFTTPLYSGITAFTVFVSVAPVADTMRDLWFVVKSSATAPTITWLSGFEPANDDADNLVAEASATTVFLISEYAPGKFLVARQTVEAAQ